MFFRLRISHFNLKEILNQNLIVHTDEGRNSHRYILLNFRPSSASLAKSVQDGIEAAVGAFTDYGR